MHLRFPTIDPRLALDDPDSPVVAGFAWNEAPAKFLIADHAKLVALQDDPIVGSFDLRVVGRDDGVVAGIVGEVEHAGAGAAAAVLLELRVDEEGREDDAEEQEDAAQDGTHVRDLLGNFQF